MSKPPDSFEEKARDLIHSWILLNASLDLKFSLYPKDVVPLIISVSQALRQAAADAYDDAAVIGEKYGSGILYAIKNRKREVLGGEGEL